MNRERQLRTDGVMPYQLSRSCPTLQSTNARQIRGSDLSRRPSAPVIEGIETATAAPGVSS